MWPSTVMDQSGLHVSMPMYTAQPYAAAPGDMYAHAAAAAGFEGWAVAQQQHQAYVTLNRGMGHPTHMLQPHLAAAHGMGHPMLAQPQHHVMPGSHIGMVQQPQNAAAAAAPGLMMTWAPQHVMPNMRAPTNGINSSHMVSQDMVANPNWPASGGGGRGSNGYSSGSGRGMHTRQGSGGSGSGMLGGQQQQFFGNSGGRGRGRRNIVFNTKPGEQQTDRPAACTGLCIVGHGPQQMQKSAEAADGIQGSRQFAEC